MDRATAKAPWSPRLIGFVGRRRVGKDAAASYLSASHGYATRKFAGAMKDALRHLFDFSEAQLEDTHLKECIDPRWGVSPRAVMQFFGTEVLQHQLQRLLPSGLGTGFAVKRLFIGESSVGLPPLCVSDVRFQHEADAIRERGGTLVRIVRDAPSTTTDADAATDAHISEAAVDGIACDWSIYNNGSIDELHASIDCLLRQLSRLVDV